MHDPATGAVGLHSRASRCAIGGFSRSLPTYCILALREKKRRKNINKRQ
jgi:hypothetical protein